MYSISYIINGKRVWAINPKTHTHYYKTKQAYNTHLATALAAAKDYKKAYPAQRVEVETFYNNRLSFYITII